jgi:two-component system cell cycle sensor histidine kinase/response regulator CckA
VDDVVELERLQSEVARLRTKLAMLEAAESEWYCVREGLTEARAKLDALLDNTDDFILFSDHEARPVFFNRSYALMVKQLLGIEMRPGLKPHELLPEGPERAVWDEWHARVLAGEKFRCEYHYTDPEGKEYAFEVSFNPVRQDGEVVGFSELTRNITERKIAERALREAHDRLGVAVRERTEELRCSEERLRQSEKMDAIGQLAGGIAHDFNNQLVGVLGYADLLTHVLSDPGHRDMAEKIVAAAERAGELTRQLLAFARKGRLRTDIVDVHSTIGEVVSLLKHSIDKRIQIREVFEASPSTTVGDPAQLQNAVLNLALNARDAMPAGGHLTFRTRTEELSLADCQGLPFLVDPGPYIVIQVVDTGHGIEPEVQRRMFEPFFTTKETGKGTGMGLASVYGTVASHRGAIRLATEQGKGTELEILLPLFDQAAATAGEIELQHGRSRRLRVLIVEDEALVRQTLVVMLHSLGHEVVAAVDGEDGLEKFRDPPAPIDLVILDLVMPRMSGGEAFREMRRSQPMVPILLASGYSRVGEAQALLEAGAAGFLQKPFRRQALADAIENAITGERDRATT